MKKGRPRRRHAAELLQVAVSDGGQLGRFHLGQALRIGVGLHDTTAEREIPDDIGEHRQFESRLDRAVARENLLHEGRASPGHANDEDWRR